MKKISALILALALLASALPAALAVNPTHSSTTLTTTVPSARYVLNIPADQTVTYGETRTYIGNVTITDSQGFSTKKIVTVTVEYAPFAAEAEEISTTIPYTLYQTLATDSSDSYGNLHTSSIASGGKMLFGVDDVDGDVLAGYTQFTDDDATYWPMNNLIVQIESEDWLKALAGDYKSTITFTSEISVMDH